jgi:FAD/FMN-containing dehydrogenase
VSTAEVQDRVRAGAPLRIRGGGSWLDAGRPVTESASLSLADDDAIVEYVPGDLTLTARAGSTLSAIAKATSAEGQWLALDPFGAQTSTLGATIATASAGPLAHSFGTPRDAVLGLEVVTGIGDIVRSGGRVVKNVAGFDLTRLFTGAWGTLAVITEATVRLRARPERDETIAFTLPAGDELDAWLSKLNALPFSPLALEMVNAAMAAALGLDPRALLLARLGGNNDSVRAQRQLLAVFGDATEIPTSIWSALAEVEPLGAAVVRVSAPINCMESLWTRLSAGDDILVHGTIGRGVVRCIRPASSSTPIESWLDNISRCIGTHIFERLPASEWSAIPSRVNDPLSRAVRAAFDPARILNRGILGEHG